MVRMMPLPVPLPMPLLLPLPKALPPTPEFWLNIFYCIWGGIDSLFAGFSPCWGNWARGYRCIATYLHVSPRWLARISLPFLSLTAEGRQEEEEARYKRRGENHCGSREGLTQRTTTKEERKILNILPAFSALFLASVTPSLNFAHLITY